jgi:long-chain acyl-CoA synthetase
MFTAGHGTPLGTLAEAAEMRFGDTSRVVFEGRTQTSAEIGALARRFAAGLSSLGVRTGDRVAVCMANCIEVLASYHAIWRIGAAVTPLLFLLSEDELRNALTDSAAAVVVTTPEFLPKVLAASAGLPTRVVVAGGGAEGDVVSFAELSAGAEAPLVPVDPGELAALLYTGGTTGRSKGVMLSHDALSYAAWAGVHASEQDEFSVGLLPLPMAHAFGLTVSALAMHAVRPSRTVLMRWFDPVGWLQLAQDEHVQHGALVPTMLRLLATMPLEDYDLSALRKLTSGSAPLPAEIAEQWAVRVPNCDLVEGYGCSETAALASLTRTGRARRGSVGQAAPGVELCIDDPDDTGNGEICVRTPSLMTGYWHDPDATAAAVRDGWFHTGDVGHLDADGYLFIVDRLKDVVIRNGFNVYPRDVEEALMRHPEVAVCAVVGRPDEEAGEEVVAFVQTVAGSSVSAEQLVAYAREHLSAVKYPREVHLIDTLPLTSIGKLDRKALRTRL